MRVRFWGVRGSVPWSTQASIAYGCNTACLEVVDEPSGRRLILDAGTGIVGAGGALDAVTNIAIVLTHYHWDHVQGLPFFVPFFRPGSDVTVWTPALGGPCDIEAMFAPPFFPMPSDRLPSSPSIRRIETGRAEINGFDVRAQPLNHPGGAFAYRIAGADGDLVYATDHEFGNAHIDRGLGQFSRGAGALVLDAHFTPDEMPLHKGWGHSDWSQCAQFAESCGARQLWLFHHKPGRNDDDLTGIEIAAATMFRNTRAAKEGDTFDL